MAKILVFQHVAFEPLGTLDPLVRGKGHRIKYVNFARTPSYVPKVSGYDALIILGGPMNVGEEHFFPHLEQEKKAILQAIALDIPVLGICLGAQLIASALGAKVYPAPKQEIGWYPMKPTNAGLTDPVIRHFEPVESIFQWHKFTFDMPVGAIRLVEGDDIVNQAFRYKNNVYGFQFHLEADYSLIKRWLNLPEHQTELGLSELESSSDKIWQETLANKEKANQLSRWVFSSFLELVPAVKRRFHLPHRFFGSLKSA